jgi:hypothetical protein
MTGDPFELTLTEQGYLRIPSEIAGRCFPHDLVACLLRPRELWLMPTRGAGAGGLILKQRNAEGERSVLVHHLLPPDILPGPRLAYWDAAQGALRIALTGMGNPRSTCW